MSNAIDWTRPLLHFWLGYDHLHSPPMSQLWPVAKDLLATGHTLGVATVTTDEPRQYRLTPRGTAQLRTAVEQGRATLLIAGTMDIALLWQGAPTGAPGVIARVQGHIRLPDQDAVVPVAHRLTTFFRRWFVPLAGVAAFVSTRTFDFPNYTEFEQAKKGGPLITLRACQDYLRGCFWANGWNGDHCERLGGVVAVLRHAPVPIAERLGEGVWLQCSATPPASPETIEALAAFAEPLLTWTLADKRQAEAEDAHRLGLTVFVPGAAPSVGMPPGPRPQLRTGRMVPVRHRQPVDVDVTLNIVLAAPPTPEQCAQVHELLKAWYDDGFRGAFGDGFLHEMTQPVDDTEQQTIRCHIDMGSADVHVALRDLRRRLASLKGVTVTRLVTGTETVR